MDFVLSPPPPSTSFSSLWYTISNKSQSFVFLSPSFFPPPFPLLPSLVWHPRRHWAGSLRTGGEEKKEEEEGRERQRLNSKSEGLWEFCFRQSDDLQAQRRAGLTVVFLCYLVLVARPRQTAGERGHVDSSVASWVIAQFFFTLTKRKWLQWRPENAN